MPPKYQVSSISKHVKEMGSIIVLLHMLLLTGTKIDIEQFLTLKFVIVSHSKTQSSNYYWIEVFVISRIIKFEVGVISQS